MASISPILPTGIICGIKSGIRILAPNGQLATTWVPNSKLRGIPREALRRQANESQCNEIPDQSTVRASAKEKLRADAATPSGTPSTQSTTETAEPTRNGPNNRASCEKRVRPSFCLRRRGERGSADGKQRSQGGSDRHRRRGAGDAGVHGACLPVMRASTREEMRRISFTSRSSSRLFLIHSR